MSILQQNYRKFALFSFTLHSVFSSFLLFVYSNKLQKPHIYSIYGDVFANSQTKISNHGQMLWLHFCTSSLVQLIFGVQQTKKRKNFVSFHSALFTAFVSSEKTQTKNVINMKKPKCAKRTVMMLMGSLIFSALILTVFISAISSFGGRLFFPSFHFFLFPFQLLLNINRNLKIYLRITITPDNSHK